VPRFQAEYGRAPNQRELASLLDQVNLRTRKDKDGVSDWDETERGWQAKAAQKAARTLRHCTGVLSAENVTAQRRMTQAGRSHHFHVVTAQHAKIQRAQFLKPRRRQTAQMFQQVPSGIPGDARSVDVQLVLHQAHVWLGARNGDEALLGQFVQPGPALKEVRRFDEAITACQDAAAIFRDTGDRHGEGLALEGVGRALDKAGGPGKR
jgi:hypothetical protein